MASKQKKKANRIVKTLFAFLIVIVLAFLGYLFIKINFINPAKSDISSVQSRSRDAVRKSALNSFSVSLEEYKSIHGSYPIRDHAVPLSSLQTEKINIPSDPLAQDNIEGKHGWVSYCYQTDPNGAKFTIWAKLENPYDEKTSQINKVLYFSTPSGFEPNYYFMQSEE